MAEIITKSIKCFDLQYDVALSFAGEDRRYVEKVAEYLSNKGVRVFYDIYEEVDLWGKDLYQHLDDVYQNKAKYTIVFISENYEKKLWTNHELKSAQARAFVENSEYILPVKFDNTDIPGIRKTTGFLDIKNMAPAVLGEKIVLKLGDIEPVEHIPLKKQFVYDFVRHTYSGVIKRDIDDCVNNVFTTLKSTTDKERHLLTTLHLHTCPHDITTDLHQDIALFERMSGYSKTEILGLIKGLTHLGFEYTIKKKYHGCENDGNLTEYEELSLKLMSRRTDLAFDNLTIFLYLIYYGARRGHCSNCSYKVLNRLDFTNLMKKMTTKERDILIEYVPNESEEIDS